MGGHTEIREGAVSPASSLHGGHALRHGVEPAHRPDAERVLARDLDVFGKALGRQVGMVLTLAWSVWSSYAAGRRKARPHEMIAD